jgi:hypothetical protein
MTPEGQLVRSCLDLLDRLGVFCWRNNTGAIVAEYKGKERVIRYGYRGSSDIFGITNDGRMICIEAKVKTKLSSYQEHFLAAIRERGGIAIVVHPDDYVEVITEALGLL